LVDCTGQFDIPGKYIVRYSGIMIMYLQTLV